MFLGKIAKIVSLLVGIALALPGSFAIAMVLSGAVVEGGRDAAVFGIGMLLVALPFLIFPFSVHLARWLGVLLLLALIPIMLWLVFSPDFPATHPAMYQVAAIAFSVLLIARIGLALRDKRSQSSRPG